MVRPTEREITRAIVGEELNLVKLALRPLGDYYHSILRGYGKPDRGLKEVLNWLLYTKNEIWPFFIEKRTEVSLSFPYIREEAEVLNKLTEQIKEVDETVKNVIESKRRTLYPEEFSDLTFNIQNIRIYMDYVAGRDYLTCKILEEEKVRSILEEFRPSIEAFERKLVKNDDYPFTFYMGRVEEYSFLTLFIVNAYSNSLLKSLLEAKSEEEMERILKNYSLSSGLNQILFSAREKMREYSRRSLRERKERENLCLPRSLVQRIKVIDKGSKFSSSVEKIYGSKDSLLYTY